MKLCLLRGLISAVRTAFMSESESEEPHMMVTAPGLAPGFPCSFEHFIWKWNTAWLEIATYYEKEPRLMAIIFRMSLYHAKLTDSMSGISLPGPFHWNMLIDFVDKENARALLRFTEGDWTSFPPVQDTPYLISNSTFCKFQQIWDSPPEEDPKPRRVETARWEDNSESSTRRTDSNSCRIM